MPLENRSGKQKAKDWHKFVVKAGEVLAQKHPIECLGEKGIDIFGNFVDPEIPKDVHILCGPGVELVEEGMKAVAAIEGRALLVDNRLCVLPLLEIEDNLVGKNGAVTFPGDVIVRGNVLDGASINAQGKVFIQGNVVHGEVSAGGEIVIQGNVINSFVRAGAVKINLEKALNYVQETVAQGQKLLEALKLIKYHLHEEGPDKRDYIYCKILLNKKFQKLPTIIKMAGEELERIQDLELLYIPQLRGLVKHLEEFITQSSSVDFLISLERLLTNIEENQKALERFSQEMEFSSAPISCHYTQYSLLQASGSIEVTEKGSYMSTLEAGGDIILKGANGNILGGVIKTGGSLTAHKIGSEMEIKTKIIVPSKYRIRAIKIYGGVEIRQTQRQASRKIVTVRHSS